MGGLGGTRVARAIVSIALAIVACVACGESRMPAKSAMRPAGNGWFCWRNARIRSSSCQRTKDACVASRAKAVTGKEGEDADAYSECDAQSSAGCFTHKTKAGVNAWYCAASYDDCESIARTVSRDPEHAGDFDEMSQCESWD